ncbi:MAG: oligogalacturonate-specific porin KdgM family protein [Vibrio sp.]|uniref:oligogalacturonate-specific porin KdgM family protein n=1 Tax=Vibrio sp. TaxID=678 RepID=UPI003A8475C0
MKKVLTSAILLALTATGAQAASVNLRHEYKPEFGDQKSTYADRIEVSHRFKSGIGFAVESKYKDEDSSSDHNDDLVSNGSQANISYQMKLNDSFTLTPQYKIEGSGDMAHQFNLTLGYKVNDDWSVSYRQRYNQSQHDNYYNQGTFAFSYKGIEDWGVSGSLDYRVTGGDNKAEVWDGEDKGISEINFKGQYNGLESGWKPFAEFGVTPSKKDSSDTTKDNWRPRLRVGVVYNF